MQQYGMGLIGPLMVVDTGLVTSMPLTLQNFLTLYSTAVPSILLSNYLNVTMHRNLNPFLMASHMNRGLKCSSFERNTCSTHIATIKSDTGLPPSECTIDLNEAKRLQGFDPVTFGGSRHHYHSKRHHLSKFSSNRFVYLCLKKQLLVVKWTLCMVCALINFIYFWCIEYKVKRGWIDFAGDRPIHFQDHIGVCIC